MCPFCYIGKRKFEKAMSQFSGKNNVEIEWKSYQLMPALKTQEGRNLDQFLAEEKGISPEQAKAMNARAVQMAELENLVYNFDKAIPANTFDAHRFIHAAKQEGKQEEAEEMLFRSYFTDGKNIDDHATLLELGKDIGLNTDNLKTALQNGSFAEDVQADIQEAQEIGVRGVPFFVFNRKYAVSGAQDSQVFLQTLEKSFEEWQKENPGTNFETIEGKVCTPGQNCD